jgi:methionine-rich copper-binding protein CopC
VAATNRLTLTFSERLMPQLSGIDLAMTGMPGMANHAPMKIGGVQTTVGEDGKTLIAALPRPLAAGTYKLDWHVVSVDTHRIAGSLTFTVR